MKFLKKNTTEAGYCAAAADKLALAHPEVAVRFMKDGATPCARPEKGSSAAPYTAYVGVTLQTPFCPSNRRKHFLSAARV